MEILNSYGGSFKSALFLQFSRDFFSNFQKMGKKFRYVFILDEFDRNTPELNKAVVKMLHRIAFDLRMPIKLFQVFLFAFIIFKVIFLFQLSLFRIFNRIGEHFANVKPEDRKKRSFFEVYEFGYHLLKKLVFFFIILHPFVLIS